MDPTHKESIGEKIVKKNTIMFIRNMSCVALFQLSETR